MINTIENFKVESVAKSKRITKNLIFYIPKALSVLSNAEINEMRCLSVERRKNVFKGYDRIIKISIPANNLRSECLVKVAEILTKLIGPSTSKKISSDISYKDTMVDNYNEIRNHSNDSLSNEQLEFLNANPDSAIFARFLDTNSSIFHVEYSPVYVHEGGFISEDRQNIMKVDIYLKNTTSDDGEDVLLCTGYGEGKSSKVAKAAARANSVKLLALRHAEYVMKKEQVSIFQLLDSFQNPDEVSYLTKKSIELETLFKDKKDQLPSQEDLQSDNSKICFNEEEDDINESFERRQQFISSKPASNLLSLPALAYYDQILKSVYQNPVTIISGATGSGKTTQIPQYILSHYDHLKSKMPMQAPSILVTQPRRMAAISIAKRIAVERGEPLGESVGYMVRFDSVKPKNTSNGSITFCTIAILLRMLAESASKRTSAGSLFDKYTHIIIDEVHERSLDIDLCTMLFRKLIILARDNPNIKVPRLVLMSATLSVDLFEKYFSEKGISAKATFNLSGTNFPVKKHHICDIAHMFKHESTEFSPKTQDYISSFNHGYEDSQFLSSRVPEDDVPIRLKEQKDIPMDLIVALIEHLIKKDASNEGSILVFLPGWAEITKLNDLLFASRAIDFKNPSYKIYTLHSTVQLDSEDSDLLFKKASNGVRKIVLATNIAESSVTIPDVTSVIDSCRHRIMMYDPRTGVNSLVECWISHSNILQRLGRAGRCAAGDYYSLISKNLADNLPMCSKPELLRLGLEEVCLYLKCYPGLNPEDSLEEIMSELLSPPPSKNIYIAVKKLMSLKALDHDELPTLLGRALNKFPADPSSSKMILLGAIFKALHPIVDAIALVSGKPIRVPRFQDGIDKVSNLLAEHFPTCSDHLMLLQIYEQFNNTKSFNFCDQRNISYSAMINARKVALQFLQTLSSELYIGRDGFFRYNINSNVDILVRFILASGLYPNIALETRRAKQTSVKTSIKKQNVISKYFRRLRIGNFSVVNENNKPLKKHVLPASPTTFSLNPVDANSDTRIFAYQTLINTSNSTSGNGSIIDTASVIPPAALCLLAEEMLCLSDPKDSNYSLIKIDGWLNLRLKSDVANLLVNCRNVFDAFVNYKLQHMVIAGNSSHSRASYGNSSDFTKEHGVVEIILSVLKNIHLHK